MTTPPEHDPTHAIADIRALHPDFPTVHSDDQADAQVPRPDHRTADQAYEDAEANYAELYHRHPEWHDMMPHPVAPRLPSDIPENRVVHSLVLISRRLERIENLALQHADSLVTAHEKMDWMHRALMSITQVMAGIQQAALSMGGPMGTMIRKMTGGNGNG